MVLGGVALGLIAIFLPPLAVLVRAGCGVNFLLNIVLLFLGWLPAVLHAWYVILEYPNARQRHAEHRAEREMVRERSRRRSRSLDAASRRSYDRLYPAQPVYAAQAPAGTTEYVYDRPPVYKA